MDNNLNTTQVADHHLYEWECDTCETTAQALKHVLWLDEMGDLDTEGAEAAYSAFLGK